MIDIKCPKCASKDFDCHDTDFDRENGIHWDLCWCDNCGANFNIRYVAVEIEEDED